VAKRYAPTDDSCMRAYRAATQRMGQTNRRTDRRTGGRIVALLYPPWQGGTFLY